MGCKSRFSPFSLLTYVQYAAREKGENPDFRLNIRNPIQVLEAAILALCLTSAAFAQTPAAVPARDASFVADSPAAPVATAPVPSGLAALPEPVTVPLSSPVPTPTTPAPVAAPADIVAVPVDIAPLPHVSPESVGTRVAGNLGADMWRDTPRSLAEKLLSMASPTASPTLNDLARRALATAAVPPAGDGASATGLTSLRVEKLAAFGDPAAAWSLATHADPALIDDKTMRSVAEIALADQGDDVCARLPHLSETRPHEDWLKILAVCQLRAKDTKAAQVTLDLLRAEKSRDDLFLLVADRNLIGTAKTLPTQLTPLTPALLALLRLSGLPLPGELYGHPDAALIASLLRAPAQQDVAQLGLAERAAQRGIIDAATLEAIYRGIAFAPDELTAPLTASESGSRLRALLFKAATGDKDPLRRIACAIKFMQSASPALLNGAGAVAADMLGEIPAAAHQADAAALAQIYLLAGRNEAARDWLRLAPDPQMLWPSLALAGLATEGDSNAALDAWLDAALKQADLSNDPRSASDKVAASLLLLDAAGLTVPDAAWAKIMTAPHNEKHIALSPLLLARLAAAATANRRAESVFLSIDLADGDQDMPLPTALAITRALRAVGLNDAAATFARDSLALLDSAH